MSSSQNSKGKLHSYKVEVLLDVSKRVEEVGDLFIPRDGESLQGNGSSIAMKQLKKLEQGLFSKMLKLNVGGQLFLISLETLKKDSGNFETY